MANEYIWKQEIECGGFAGLKPFLFSLAERNRCDFKILRDRSTFWKDKLTVEFIGKEENLISLQEEFIFCMTKYNLPAAVKNAKYKIKSIVEEDSAYSREIIFKVNSSKNSKIKELAEAVADELMVASEVSEKNNGFLKGKTVQVSALGDRDKLEKFKAIFQSVIHDSLLKQQKKSKLRM